MPSVLAVVEGTPTSLEGRALAGPGLIVDRCASPDGPLAAAATESFDLLVVAGFPIDEQQRIAAAFQQHRGWRVVPVLFVVPADSGFIIPGCYRPELDGIARGAFGEAHIEARIRQMAREGTAGAELVVAGPLELDQLHGQLRCAGRAVALTTREAEILALLLEQVNRTVHASVIIERGWGSLADDRHLQILRRHVSNLRRKLDESLPVGVLRTVRGHGYRFDLRSA
jgi:DNA-binding response OmpR family regulator